MARIFDLHGLARLTVDDDRERICRYFDSQLDPYEPTVGSVLGKPDVALSPNLDILAEALCDVHGPAGDGRRSGSDGERCYLVHGDACFELPHLRSDASTVTLSYDRRFPLWDAFPEVVRPLLQLATIKRGAITVHGTAVEIGRDALIMCGWSETGKTETALALAEAGARFISDKWTIIDSGRNVHPFPVPVGIRDWVLPYLPRLRAHLGRSQRARLRVIDRSRRLLPLRGRRSANPVTGALKSQLEGAIGLAGRLSLRQSEVAAAYGASDPATRTPRLTKLAILTTVASDEVSVHEADLAWVADRLALSAAYERRGLYAADARVRYARAERGPSPLLGIADVEAELLRGLLHSVQLLEVRAPFPTDPRRVADAVARWS